MNEQDLAGNQNENMIPGGSKPLNEDMEDGMENENVNQHKESINKILKTIREAKEKKVDPWIWAPFNNPAREDCAQLSHWTKKTEKDDVYSFSKLNRKIDVIRYTPEEYIII